MFCIYEPSVMGNIKGGIISVENFTVTEIVLDNLDERLRGRKSSAANRA